MLKKILSVIAIIITMSIGNVIFKAIYQSYKNTSLQSKMDTSFENLRSQLPMMVDSTTRLDSILREDKEIIYKYTMINANSSDLDPDLLQQGIFAQHKKNICDNPNNPQPKKMFLKNGYNIVSFIYSKDGQVITKITLTPKDCRL